MADTTYSVSGTVRVKHTNGNYDFFYVSDMMIVTDSEANAKRDALRYSLCNKSSESGEWANVHVRKLF